MNNFWRPLIIIGIVYLSGTMTEAGTIMCVLVNSEL